jgi:hypothetical protein
MRYFLPTLTLPTILFFSNAFSIPLTLDFEKPVFPTIYCWKAEPPNSLVALITASASPIVKSLSMALFLNPIKRIEIPMIIA